jgi:hypothetical protein
MMQADDLEQAIRKEPFVPVRIRLTNGDILNVTHPDGIMIQPRMCAVAVGGSIQFVAHGHIVAVEPIEP